MAFYNFDQYCWMIADEFHSQPFVQILRESVTNDSIVLDIGCGTGIYSLLACQFGAKKVYAVEPNPLIHLAKNFAAQYGCQNKIEFIENISTEIELPEPADVLICDLHVDTPFNELSVASIIDARKRLLKPDAILIPRKDTMYFALAECKDFFEKNISRYLRDYYGINMSSAKRLLTNRMLHPDKKDITQFSEPKIFATLDYATLEEVSFSSQLDWEIKNKGTIHGLLGWFECELGKNIEISNELDNQQTVYGVPFFPFDEAVEVEVGDRVEVNLSVNLENISYIWNWNTVIYSKKRPTELKAKFVQSTGAGVFTPPPTSMLKQSEYFSPRPNETAVVDLLFLNLANGEMLLGDIADEMLEKFPDKFKTFEDALAYAGRLSQHYSK